MNLKAVLEGLLFLTGSEGLTFAQIKEILEIDDEKAKQIIGELNAEYKTDERGIKLELLGGSFKLTTKKEHKPYFEKMFQNEADSELSEASLEVLAIIAYNQPITRIQIDEFRGVNSAHVIRKLLIKNLIQDCGRSDLPGKPILYSTTPHFLDYFGLSSISELPPLEISNTESSEQKNLFETKYTENN